MIRSRLHVLHAQDHVLLSETRRRHAVTLSPISAKSPEPRVCKLALQRAARWQPVGDVEDLEPSSEDYGPVSPCGVGYELGVGLMLQVICLLLAQLQTPERLLSVSPSPGLALRTCTEGYCFQTCCCGVDTACVCPLKIHVLQAWSPM